MIPTIEEKLKSVLRWASESDVAKRSHFNDHVFRCIYDYSLGRNRLLTHRQEEAIENVYKHWNVEAWMESQEQAWYDSSQRITGMGHPVTGDSERCSTCGKYKDYMCEDMYMCFNCPGSSD